MGARPSKRAVCDRYMVGSTMTVETRFGEEQLEYVRITFRGLLAAIPALKNRKAPGMNFPNPDTLGRIAAMDGWFARAVGTSRLRFEGPVFAMLLCGARTRSFDPDNCLTTVKDWLEPPTKVVGKGAKPRGWGIGLVENDDQITGLALSARAFDVEETMSVLVVRRFDDVSDAALSFVKEIAA